MVLELYFKKVVILKIPSSIVSYVKKKAPLHKFEDIIAFSNDSHAK